MVDLQDQGKSANARKFGTRKRRQSPTCRRKLTRAMGAWGLVLSTGGSLASMGQAAPLYWDADGSPAATLLSPANTTVGAGLGGSGIWDNTLPLWWDGVSASNGPWTSGSTAIFSGNAGLVSLSVPTSVDTLQFATVGYNIQGGGTSVLTLSGSSSIQANVAGTSTLSASIAGSAGLNLSSSTTGLVFLNNANSFSGGVSIASGTLSVISDASLGAASNNITFTGATGGLTLATAISTNRSLILNNTGPVTLTSGTNAVQTLSGPITGTGALTLVGSSNFFLTNTTSSFSGALWVQNGTAVVNALTDSAGSGNIKLGATTTAGIFQWATTSTGPLVLANRQIELAGTTGGGTLDSSNVNQANTVSVTSNLSVSGIGAKTLTLQGNNGGNLSFSGAISGSANTFSGVISDSTSGATGLSKTGIGLWVLSGSNSYTGTTTVTQGILRIVNSSGLGAGGAFSVTGNNAAVLEMRSDSALSLSTENMTNNNSTGTFTFALDRAIGGTGANQTMLFGNIAQANNTAGFTVLGAHGYGFSTGVNTVKGAIGVTITNDLGSPGFVTPGFTNGIMTIAGLTTDATAGTATQTLAGWGDYVLGSVSTGAAGTTLNLVKSGLGLLTFSGSNTGWSSTTQGLFTLSAGTTRLTGASPIGGTNIALGGGLLELRNDASIVFSPNILGVSAQSTLSLDHTIGGTGTNALTTLGTINSGTTGSTLIVVGDRGYGLTVTGTTTIVGGKSLGFVNAVAAPGFVAAGYTPGMMTFGNITSDTTAGTATMTLGGMGDYSLAGSISSNTGLLAITKTGPGLLTFGGNNAGWVANAANVLTLSGGTTRLTAANAIGSATVALNAGLLELRSDSAVNWGLNFSAVSATSTIELDHSIGGTGSGVTQTIGTIVGSAAATLNIVGDRGYGLNTGVITVNSGLTLTLANALNAAGYTAAGYSAGLIGVSGLTNASAAVGTLVLSGQGDFNSFASNTITNTGGGTVNLTKSNLGVLSFAGTQTGWTAGTLSTTVGTTRILSTTASIGSATVGLGGGMTELRSDVNTVFSANNVTLTGTSTLVAAPLIGSSATGKTLTLGTLTGAGVTAYLDTNHGYNITFNSATAGAVTTVLANTGTGMITFTNGLTATGAAVYTFGGNGDFSVPGNITSGTGSVAFNKIGYGTLTFGGTNTFNGNLSLTGGVLRVTNAGGLGGATSTFTMQGNSHGTIGLDLRNDTGMDLSQHNVGPNSYNTIINVDRAIGGTGTNQMMVLGGGNFVTAASGWGNVVVGANGYSLQYGSAGNATPFQLNGTAAATWTLTNFVPNVAGRGSVIFNSGVQIAGTAFSNTFVLGGTGDYLLSGTLSAGGAGVGVNTLSKSGAGTLTLSADNSNSTTLLGFNTLTSTSTAASLFSLTGGITRISSGNNLGGANTTVTLSGATLDIRSDTGATLAQTLTVGANNSTLNIDRAIGGAGTAQSVTLGGLKIGAFTAFFTNGNNYSLNTGAVTLTGNGTLVNSLAGTGALTIPTLTGTFNVNLTGSGNTNLTTALTLVTGTLTKTGTGTLTISGNAGGLNTNGAVTVIGGGTLALDYSTGAPANILQSTATLTLQNGSLSVKGAASGTTTQTLGNVTLNSNGQSNITLNPNGGGGTTLTLGTLTATNNGSTMLITEPAGSTVTFNSGLDVVTSQGRNVVLFDGTSFNWAANTGVNTATVAASYNPMITSGTNALNSISTDVPSSTLTTNTTTNSLKIDTTNAGGGLHLDAFNLTLTQGGILFVGGNAFTIDGAGTTTGLKSATASNSDVVVNNYGTGVLTISAPIINGVGTSIFTHGGTGTTIVGNTALGAIGGYGGSTINNGGTLRLAAGGSIVRLGSTVNTNLTVNGGTVDLNGNSIGVGGFNGTYNGTLDNTAVAPVTITIGNNNSTGTYLGTIKNTGGAISIVKTGTGAITLGDTTGMSSLAFTGDLTMTGGSSTLTIGVPLADSVGAKINLGDATAANTQTLTFVGNANFVLNNRQLDLTGQSSAVINANGVVGQNGTGAVMVINTNLLTDGTGTKTLTLSSVAASNVANGLTVTGLSGSTVGTGTVGSGQVAVVNQFNGIIGNPAGGAGNNLNLTIAGAGSWVLGGANTFTGNVTLSSTGTVRATNANSFGNSANVINVTGSITLDLRSDSNMTIANPITMNSSFTINVDRAIGGNGYGNVITVGAVTEATTGLTLKAVNLAGPSNQLGNGNPVGAYGLRISGLNLTAGTATTIANNIAMAGPAFFATPAVGTGVPGALVIDSITAAGGLGTHTLTINANGNNVSNGVTIIPGDITQGAGTTLGITNNTYGVVTLAGTAATNYSGGFTMSQANGTVRATTPFSFGVGALSVTAGNVELRSDTSATYTATALSWSGNANFQLNVGESINGVGGHGNIFTLPALNITVASGKTMTIAGVSAGGALNAGSANNSGDSVVIGGVTFGAGNLSNTITNNLLLPGTLSLGNITGAGTTGTSTLTLSGSGVTTIGNVVNGGGGGLAGVTYAGTGVLDLSAATSANAYTGGFRINSGTVRSINTNSFGAGSNVVTLGGGTLELRSDSTLTTYANPFTLVASSTVAIGQLPGGTGFTGGYGNTVRIAGGLTLGTTAVTMTVAGIGGSTASNGYNLDIPTVNVNAASPTINNNMPIPSAMTLGAITSTGTGTNVLSIGGSGLTRITGDILNGSATAVGLTYGGTSVLGILDLGGVTASTVAAGGYTGGLNINGGTVRVSNAFAFGPSTNIVNLGTAALEIRSDTSVTYNNPLYVGGAGAVLSVGQLPGGTASTGGYGNLITVGQLTVSNTTGKGLTIAGIGGTSGTGNSYSTDSDGYSVRIQGINAGGVLLGAVANTTLFVTNTLQSPATVTINNVTNAGTIAGTDVVILNGAGITLIPGDITDSATTGVKTAITYSGSGFLNLAGTAATNYTGGLTISSGTVRATTAFSLGAASNTVSLNGGTLEIRSDTNVAYNSPMILPNSSTITVGQLPGGTSSLGGYGNTVTLGALTSTVTAKTLTLAGIAGTSENDGYSVTIPTINANVLATTVTNNLGLPGKLTVGAVTSGVAGANVLTFAGNGLINVTGDITTGTATSLGIVYSGAGILNLNSTAATNYAGGLQVTGSGTVRVNSVSSLGTGTNPLTLNAGVLDLRLDTGTTFANPISEGGGGINIDRAVGGSGSTQTHTFTAPLTFNATGKTMTVTGGNGYNLAFTGGVSVPAGTAAITNNSSGLLSFTGTGVNAITNSGTATLTFSGGGRIAVADISQSTSATPMSVTYTGTGLLDLSATNVIAPTTPYNGPFTLNGTGTVLATNVNNLGAGTAMTLGGSGIIQWRNDANASLPQAITVTGSYTLDVGAATTATGKTLTLASISTPTATAQTQTFTGRDGYSVVIGSLALPGTTGQTTTFVANVPVTITGNVTNNEVGFATGNFDTLVLDGIAGGTINGTISDAVAGSKTLGGYTPLTKQGPATWTLSGANSTFTGPTSITAGTLVLNAAGAISSTNTVTVNGATAVLTNTTNGALAGTGTSLTLTAGIVAFPNSNSYTGTTTLTAGSLSVGNVGSLGTGPVAWVNSTVQASSDLSAGLPNTVTLTGTGVVAGANNLTFNGGFTNSGGNRTLTSNNTATTTLAGPVYLSESLTTARTFTINGTGPVTVSGAITDVNGIGLAGTFNYSGTSTLTLSGNSVHTGPSNFSGVGSNVKLTGSLGNTAVNVTAGTFSPAAGTSIGNIATGGAGATLTMGTGTTLNLADGVAGNFTILGGTTFAAANTSFNLTNAALSFDVNFSTTTADLLQVGTGGTSKAVTAGLNPVTLNLIGAPAVGSYPLISATGAGSAVNGGTYSLTNPGSLTVGPTTYLFQLVSSPTSLVLNITTGSGNLPIGYWASRTGNGSANTSSWSDGAGAATNFSSDAAGTTISTFVPDLNTNLFFTADSATHLSTTLDNNFTVNSVTFTGTGTSNTAGTSIAPGTGGAGANNALTLIGAGVSDAITVLAGSGPNAISANVVLGASQAWAINGASLSVSGVISDAGSNYSLTKEGTGVLNLSGNNTHGGGTTLLAGTLNINAQGTGPTNSAIGTGPLTLTGGTFDVPSGPINLTGTTNNTQIWSNGGNVAFTGTNALNLGTGTVTLGADATTSTFTLTNNSALPGVSLRIGGNITSGVGGTAGIKTMVIGGAGNTAITGNITVGTAAGVVVTSASSGTLTLTGANSITTLNVNGGAGSVVDLSSTGTLTLTNAGGSFIQSTTGGTINGTGTAGIVLNSTNGATANYGDNGTVSGTVLTINAVVSGPFGWETWGGSTTSTGVTVLTAANIFTGDVSITGGILSVANIGNTGSTTSNLGAGTNIYITSGNGTSEMLRYTGAGETTNRVIQLNGSGGIAQESTLGGLLKFTADMAAPGANTKTFYLAGSTSAAGEFAGKIVDNSTTNKTNIQKNGTGTWTLSGANTYTGTTTAQAGTLILSGSNTTSGVTINAGTNTTVIITKTNASGTGNLTAGTGSTSPIFGLHIDGAGSGGTITVPNTWFQNSSISATIDVNNTAAIEGTGNQNNVVQLGAAAAPTWGGGDTLNVTGGNGYALSMTAMTTNQAVLANTLNPTSAAMLLAGYSGTASGNHTLVLDGTNSGNQASNLNLGSLTTLNITKSNSSTWALVSANLYNGVTAINGGVLSTGATGLLANGGVASSIGLSSNSAANLIINGGTLRFASTGTAQSTDRLFTIGTAGATLDASGTNAVTFAGNGVGAANQVVLAGSNAARTFSLTGSGTGVFSPILGDNGTGATSMIKSGVGRWTLTNTSTYSGSTQVTAGSLIINGSLATATSAVTVSTGATLGGTGSLQRPLTFNGGTLAPGVSTGTLDVTGPVTFAAASTLAIEIDGATAGDGPGFYDRVNVLGTGNAVTGTSNVSLSLSATPNVPISPSALLFILTRQDSAATAAFANYAEGATFTLADGRTGQITYLADFGTNALTGGNDVALYNVQDVPEPAALGLLAAGAVGLLSRRRRRATR